MKKLILLTTLILLTGTIFALSLEEARELALAHSRGLAQYNLRVRTNELDEKLLAYGKGPSLSMGVSAGTTLWNNEGSSGELITDSFSAGVNLELSQSLSLWDGGKNGIQKQIRAMSSASLRQDALAEYYAALDAADTAYYGALRAAASLEAAESSLAGAVLSLATAEIRRESGMLSDAEYLQALAEKESRETSRNQARRDLTLSTLRLGKLLGLEEAPELEAIDFGALQDLIDVLAGMDEAGIGRVYEDLWKEVLARNPALAKAGLNLSQAEKNTALAKREYSPTLSVSLSAGLGYSVPGGDFRISDGKLSIRGQIPLDFWVTAANVEKRQAAQEQSVMDYQNTLSSLDTEVQTALLDLVSQAGQTLSSSRALDYALKRYEYVQGLYGLSRTSLLELYNAEVQLQNSRNQFNNARYGLLSALSKIRTLGAFESEEDIRALLLRGSLR